MRSSDFRRRGFTLLEVIVALLASSLVVLATHQLFSIVVDSAERVPSAARAINHERNGQRLLRELFARVEVGTGPEWHFAGYPHQVRFHSWCSAAGGWLEPCAVELSLVTTRDSVALDVVWGRRRTRIGSASGSGRFMYLRSAALGGTWIEAWGDAISVPLAVQIELADRTMFLRIGTRG